MTSDMAAVLLRELEGFEREIGLFPDDESVWATVPGISNSAGNLALHVAGNIQHFIGAVFGGIGYVRDRRAEFERCAGSRGEIAAEIAAAAAVVRDVLPRLTAGQLAGAIETGHGHPVPARLFLLHLCTHAAYHLGQAGYLRRVVTGDVRSTETVSAARLS